jgi:methionine synthase II (cobalamin-independent)
MNHGFILRFSHENGFPMTQKPFAAGGLPTLIGSIPLASHDQAMDWILEHTPDIPLWPQLPGLAQEGMLVQFLEGFPGLASDGGKTSFNTESPTFADETLAFFEEYLALVDDPTGLAHSRFQVSKERAAGLYCLAERMKGRNSVAIKGQITGPFTLLTGVTDQAQRASHYDPTLREIIHKGLAMKAAWQVQFLKQINEHVILFMDEPALAGFGSSAFISISRESLIEDQNEIITAIKEAGGLAGVHVCANTDWPLLLSLDYDIINFDAYGFFDRFVSYKSEIHAFLKRGGIIAWGIVPTGKEEDVHKESSASLTALWKKQAAELCGDGWDHAAILRQSLITPSCGTGSLSPAAARKVLEMTRDTSAALRREYLP